jgi:YARHG domain
MKSCLHYCSFFFLLFGSVFTYANDGSFRVEGNQLIPMYETDISVKKEILTIKRLNTNHAIIDVYYEFFNPKEDKELEVGFEAYSPMGDVDPRPVNGRHPYINRFSVIINGENINYKVAIVSDSLYFKNGKYKTRRTEDILKEDLDIDNPGFFYVYHFRALFKKGLNIIHHNYVVELSSSVSEDYSLSYVLTAAGRWANRQIDDFTLNIDMGDFQDLSIEPTFFKNPGDWQISGRGKQSIRRSTDTKYEKDMPEFFVQKGMLSFQKKNFKPMDEFHMHAYNSYFFGVTDEANKHTGFDSKLDALPFSIKDQDQIGNPANDLSKTILKNLPYARRGYIFKNPELKAFYSRQSWYLRDPAYIPEQNQLTEKEKIWLSQLAGKVK